jgi:hypothetical protein
MFSFLFFSLATTEQINCLRGKRRSRPKRILPAFYDLILFFWRENAESVRLGGTCEPQCFCCSRGIIWEELCSLGGRSSAGMMPAFCCLQAYNGSLKATFSIHTSPIPLPTESLLESRTGGWVETSQDSFQVKLFWMCSEMKFVLTIWETRRKSRETRSFYYGPWLLLPFLNWTTSAHLSDFVCVEGVWVSWGVDCFVLFDYSSVFPFRVCYHFFFSSFLF